MKKISATLLLSLLLVTCSSGANNPNLWNRTFKSTGRTVVDYSAKLENNKTKKTFLKENYPNNINWYDSGVYFDYSHSILMEFPLEIRNDFNYFIDSLNDWWMRDKLSPMQQTFYSYKNMFDHITTKVKLIGNNSGQVTFHSNIVKDKPTDVIYDAYDDSEKLDGSFLKIRVVGHAEDVGYVRYTRYNDIINIRSGYNPDSVIEFKIILNETRDNMDEFSLYDYIEIKEVKHNFPWWGIFLIVFGSVVLVGIVYLIIKQYRRNHHKY